MDPVSEQKCSACGGPLRFDSAKQMLVCDYCGSEFPIEKQPGVCVCRHRAIFMMLPFRQGLP